MLRSVQYKPITFAPLIQSCAVREDFDPPYTLLQLTGVYFQKVRVLLRQPDLTPELDKVHM